MTDEKMLELLDTAKQASDRVKMHIAKKVMAIDAPIELKVVHILLTAMEQMTEQEKENLLFYGKGMAVMARRRKDEAAEKLHSAEAREEVRACRNKS